jgi:hypothetical protein
MKHLLVLFAFLPALSMAAPSVSISVNPATGTAPYQATLTWGSNGAVSCEASDGWSGPKATSGTQAVTISAATKFTLTCTAADGQTTLTWTNPTQNTDGTPLTDHAGTNIYRGTSAANLARVKSVGRGISSTTDTSLASGTYLYAATAVNTSSVESDKSATASVVVAGSSSVASASAAVQSTPNPPVDLVVTSLVAYEVRPNSQGVMSASRIGIIPASTPCTSESRTASGVQYHRIDLRAVDFVNWPSRIPPRDVFARCAAG